MNFPQGTHHITFLCSRFGFPKSAVTRIRIFFEASSILWNGHFFGLLSIGFSESRWTDIFKFIIVKLLKSIICFVLHQIIFPYTPLHDFSTPFFMIPRNVWCRIMNFTTNRCYWSQWFMKDAYSRGDPSGIRMTPSLLSGATRGIL